MITQHKVDPLVCAGNRSGDGHCPLGCRTSVRGDNPRFTVLAKGAVTPLITPLKTSSFTPSLMLSRGREFSPNEDVPQVLSPREGEHGGQGHVLFSIDVTIKQALMAVANLGSNIWQSLIKRKSQNNPFI